MCYFPSDVSTTYRYVLLPFQCQRHQVCFTSLPSGSWTEEFLHTSNSLVGDVPHQNIIVFIQVLFANAMQMSKLNSLLETTSWSDKKDTSDLTIGCVQKLFLELRCLNHTISTSAPPTGMCYCPSDVSATYRYVLLLFRCQHHQQVDDWPPLNDFILWYPPQKVLHKDCH